MLHMERKVEPEDMIAEWFNEYSVPDDAVPLFETENGVVETETFGHNTRPILKRSGEMEEMIRTEGKKVVDDWKTQNGEYEGILYMMLSGNRENLSVRYVGYSSKYGQDGEGLNGNLERIETNSSKLARWGYGQAYHLGKLSAATLNHYEREDVAVEDEPSKKYRRWDDALFESDSPKLQEPVYIWARAWKKDDAEPLYNINMMVDTVEKILIDLAYRKNPDALLNIQRP